MFLFNEFKCYRRDVSNILFHTHYLNVICYTYLHLLADKNFPHVQTIQLSLSLSVSIPIYDEGREQRLRRKKQRERDRRASEMAEQKEAQLAELDRARRAAQSANQAPSVAIEFIVLHSLPLQSSYFYY